LIEKEPKEILLKYFQSLIAFSFLSRDKAQNTPLHNVGLGSENAKSLIMAGII
jgi:hypothetical protein